MKKLAFVAIVLVLAAAVQAEAPFVEMSFDAALKDAGKANKLVMVDFYATWCAPCKVLDKKTWPDKAVQAFVGEHAVALKMDGEKETAVAGKYNVDSYPTILFVKADGTEAGRIVGFVEPEAFLKQAGEIVAKAQPKAP